MKINLSKPSIGNAEQQAVSRILKSGWIIRGPETLQFEQEFSKFIGGDFAVATNGCTMALYLAIKQLNLKPDDEVIVPSLTWSATAAAVIHAGAKPVFADVKLDDWCLDPTAVKRVMTNKTKLVIPVHFAGRFAEGFSRCNIPVIYDSAHRIEPGDFSGTTSCYSFYAVKNMTTVRGGMVVTDNRRAADWYRHAVSGGLTKNTYSRYKNGNQKTAAQNFYYDALFPAWNFDMTDIEAAIGRIQLQKVKTFNQKRNQIVAAYNRAFNVQNTGNHLYPILVKNRDEFLMKMKADGIQCGIHYLPLHHMKAYKKIHHGTLAVTEQIGKHCVTLPLYPALTKKEVLFIIERTLQHAVFVR